METINKAFHVVRGAAARVLVVGDAPSANEVYRGEPFVGDVALALEKHVLSPLGMERASVSVAWCTPIVGDARLEEELRKYDLVVCVGEKVRPVRDNTVLWPPLRKLAKWSRDFSEEVERKTRAAKRKLDAVDVAKALSVTLARASEVTGRQGIRIHKALEEKRIVYGVVLDPYQLDAHNDWLPPAEIEKTAHGFMRKSRMIKVMHSGLGDATPVESFIEPYPSRADYIAAMQNQPHRAFKRRFGEDVIHSGAWVLGVELSKELWERYKKGELDAFSIGGEGLRTPMTKEDMPEVRFVELGEKGDET